MVIQSRFRLLGKLSLFLYLLTFFGCVTTSSVPVAPSPTPSNVHFEKGKKQYEAGNYRSAVELLAKAAKAEPNNPLPCHWLGWSYYNLGKYDEAIIQFKISNSRKEMGSNFSGLGWSYFRRGDYVAALNSFHRYKEMASDKHKALYAIGRTFFAQEKFHDAIVQFKMANSINESTDYYGWLGYAYTRLGACERASENYSKAVSAADDLQRTRFNYPLASCYLEQGKFKKAYDLFGPKPYLGISIEEVGDRMMIQTVTQNSPASLAGLQKRDVLVSFDGVDLHQKTTETFVSEMVGQKKYGSTAIIKVERGGRIIEKKVSVGISPEMKPANQTAHASLPSKALKDAEKGSSWSIIIGISEYQHTGNNGLTNLAFADDDAKAFARSLGNLGWSKSHIKLLINENATKRNILIALESWLSKAGPQDQIILFWAGHGFPDPEDPEKVYFACYDTDIHIPATGYRMDRVRAALEERKAKNVILLADTCHAGKLITRGDGGRGISIIPDVRKRPTPKGWVFMVGADTDRQAIENSSWRNGAFTHSLIKGLNGNADGFQSAGKKDGIVTMGELKDFMVASMPNETQKVLGVAKHPVIATSTGDPNIWNLTLQVGSK